MMKLNIPGKNNSEQVVNILKNFMVLPHDFLKSAALILGIEEELRNWMENLRQTFSVAESKYHHWIKLCKALKKICIYSDEDLSFRNDKSLEKLFPHLKFFIAWMAVHNQASVLKSLGFRSLFDKERPFNNSFDNDSPIILAVCFGSKEFIRTGFKYKLFDLSDLTRAFCVAMALMNQNMLEYLAQIARDFKLPLSALNDLSDQAIRQQTYAVVNRKIFNAMRYRPLMLAMGNIYEYGVRFLLDQEINIDGYAQTNTLTTYLHYAVELAELSGKGFEIISLVKAKTRNLNQYDGRGYTAEQLALKTRDDDIIKSYYALASVAEVKPVRMMGYRS